MSDCPAFDGLRAFEYRRPLTFRAGSQLDGIACCGGVGVGGSRSVGSGGGEGVDNCGGVGSGGVG